MPVLPPNITPLCLLAGEGKGESCLELFTDVVYRFHAEMAHQAHPFASIQFKGLRKPTPQAD